MDFMEKKEPVIHFGQPAGGGSREFWMSKSPEERVEAVETIREHYYQMLGYAEPPRIRKVITIE